MDKLDPVTFVLGLGRSGTTLLRVMLAGHPELFAPPELFLEIFEDMAARREFMKERYWMKGGLRRAVMDLRGVGVEEARGIVDGLRDRTVPAVFAWLQDQLGDRMLVAKAPVLSYVPARMPVMEEWFDRPRYVWIVRHPGAVIRSFQNMPMAEMMFRGFDVEYKDLWFQGNRNIRDFLATIPEERWTRIRYEDLVAEPRQVMEEVCETIGVPFDPAVLTPYEGDRMREGPKGARAIGDPSMAGRGRIQPELADHWLEGFDPRSVSEETRVLAKALGYDLDSMPLPPIAKVTDALDALWETARELERSIGLPMDLDDVEGRRFLLRVLAASLDTFVEQADTERPRFHHAEGPHRKMFADCPDTDYLRAPIRLGPGRVYRVWGRVPPGTTYVGVLLYGRGGRVGRALDDTVLQCDAEGRFEVRVATEPQPGVWLQADGDENAVMVRQYYTSRAEEPPIEVDIAVEGGPAAPEPLRAEALATAIDRARRMLRVTFERTAQAYEMARAAALNQFVEVPVGQLFPTPDNRYQVAWYRFGPDQVLVVRGQLRTARYFGLSLCNAWMESFDYERHQVNLNHGQLHTDADGRFEVVLAHRDPGHPNWLDTAGHHAGYLIARSLLPEGPLPELSTQVMYEHELQAWMARPTGA